MLSFHTEIYNQPATFKAPKAWYLWFPLPSLCLSECPCPNNQDISCLIGQEFEPRNYKLNRFLEDSDGVFKKFRWNLQNIKHQFYCLFQLQFYKISTNVSDTEPSEPICGASNQKILQAISLLPRPRNHIKLRGFQKRQGKTCS